MEKRRPAWWSILVQALDDVGGVGQGQRLLVQELAPFLEASFHPSRALLDDGNAAGPDGVLLQVPAQLFGLDWADGRNQPPLLGAVHVWLTLRCRLVDQAGAGRGAANAVLLLESEFAELQDQLLQWLGLGLGLGCAVGRGRQPFAHGHQDGIHGPLDAAGIAGDGNVDRLLAEEVFQHAQLGAVQRKRDDGEFFLTALLLHPKGVP
jgi:hypothetical protein